MLRTPSTLGYDWVNRAVKAGRGILGKERGIGYDILVYKDGTFIHCVCVYYRITNLPIDGLRFFLKMRWEAN